MPDRKRGETLFLTACGDQRMSLRWLVFTWLKIADCAMLSLQHNNCRRTRVVPNEHLLSLAHPTGKPRFAVKRVKTRMIFEINRL